MVLGGLDRRDRDSELMALARLHAVSTMLDASSFLSARDDEVDDDDGRRARSPERALVRHIAREWTASAPAQQPRGRDEEWLGEPERERVRSVRERVRSASQGQGAKIGELGVARVLFDGMPRRDVVAWNAMISGCTRGRAEAQAVEIFGLMRAEGLRPDQFTFASVLCACARMAALEHGRRVHGVMVKSDRVAGNVFANSALVDMYLKCSSVEDARRAFAAAPERNVTMWTALISGHGQHGHAREALALFDEMTRNGFRPNDLTFLAVLSACAHGGLVDEGLRRFSSMPSDHGLTPKGAHYAAAVVDMLARVGRLRDAYELVKNLPDCQEHSVVWGALLGACRKHGDLGLVELAARRFFRLQPGNPGKYIVLANTYAACDMWDTVAGMHEAIKSLGIRKDPAWSAVEVQGKKHIFLARDTYHDERWEIYEACNALARAITEQSYGHRRSLLVGEVNKSL